MAFSSGVYTGLSNTFNNATAGTIIDQDDWNDLFTDIETAINAAANGKSSQAVTDVASASTADIGAAATSVVRITGTTTITSFGTAANTRRYILFAGSLTLTHNATSLIVPGAASITTQAGDTCLALSDASGNWRIYAYQAAQRTGTGKEVFDTSPTLVTPTLGVASATSINKVAFTAPATGSTLTVDDGKTLRASNSLTLAGTDGTTMTFPSTNATIARTDAANTFTGNQAFSGNITLGSGGVISWNSADVSITHSANNLAFSGASTGYSFDAIVYPFANDGAALGSGTNSFSDLFLASGGVINFNNGDVTLTHAANLLTFAGASNGYTFTEKITPSGGIVGTTTNDDATTGLVGEYQTASLASGSATSLSNGTAKTVISVSLTAGDWDVWGNVAFVQSSTTTTILGAAISTTNNTLPSPGTLGYVRMVMPSGVIASDYYMSTNIARISIASTTTVYLVAVAFFSASTYSAFGTIGARRVR